MLPKLVLAGLVAQLAAGSDSVVVRHAVFALAPVAVVVGSVIHLVGQQDIAEPLSEELFVAVVVRR